MAPFWAPQPEDILTTPKVLSQEYKEIWQEDAHFHTEAEYRQAMRSKDQAALCLSGGGIRSAAFALGVLQALAKKRLLSKFHYLSTVSGGGYIGAWLTRWINVERHNACEVERLLGGDSQKALPPELPQIQALRRNSNYLTPEVGISSTDTWTGIMLYARNVLINWFVFLPALILFAAVPNFYQVVIVIMERSGGTAWWMIAFLIGVLCLFGATWATCHYLPSHRPAPVTSNQIRWRIVAPALAWAFLLPAAVAVQPRDLVLITFCGAWLAKVLGFVAAWRRAAPEDRHLFSGNFVTWIVISAVTASMLSFGVYFLQEGTRELPFLQCLLLATLGPPCVTLAHLLMSTLYVAFRHADFEDDADREWLARLSAVHIFPALLWGVFAFVCLFPQFAFHTGLSRSSSAIDVTAAIVTAISGAIAVLGGKSASSTLDMIATPEQRKKWFTFDHLVTAATLVFVALLLMWSARIEVEAVDWIHTFAWRSLPLNPQWLLHPHDLLIWHLLVATILLGVIYVTSTRIDVNRFSLHGVYRNRLVRAFLGAARCGTKKPDLDPFTNFDPGDNVRMHELKAAVACTARGEPVEQRVLFPVVNVTLNLVGGKNLAWQERRASSFIITPLACGSATLGGTLAPSRTGPTMWEGAYIDSRYYGGNEPDIKPAQTQAEQESGTWRDHKGASAASASQDNAGISLGTAMTISGAAVSPSQGYNSTPATAVLLTLFNVRLGAWLANPAVAPKRDRAQSGPAFALRPLLAEMFGWTNSEGKNVYLSDGGHFDNLGLYEMVRRRCRYILIVDGGADKAFAFEDLGKAVRQAFIDLEADIVFKSISMTPRDKAKLDSPMFAVGEITYRERDEEPGLLIYIKPTYFFETAPVDVRSYGSINQDFPHESTMDQFFSESQFESYRRLGFFLASHLDRGSVSRKSKPRTYAKLGDFFARVARTAKARAKKASAPVVEAATAAAVGVPAVKVAKKAAPETRAA